MKPENAILIRLFDYCSIITFGLASALTCGSILPEGLSMPIGMVLGMILGMAVFFILLGILTRILGGFEILMPGMITSMFVGMVCGMIPNPDGINTGWMIRFGILTGFFCQLIFHLYDIKLYGEAPIEKKSDV